jgi:hypothetical protein
MSIQIQKKRLRNKKLNSKRNMLKRKRRKWKRRIVDKVSPLNVSDSSIKKLNMRLKLSLNQQKPNKKLNNSSKNLSFSNLLIKKIWESSLMPWSK